MLPSVRLSINCWTSIFPQRKRTEEIAPFPPPWLESHPAYFTCTNFPPFTSQTTKGDTRTSPFLSNRIGPRAVFHLVFLICSASLGPSVDLVAAMVSSRMLHVSPCVRLTGMPNAPVQRRRACASAEWSAKLDAVSTPTPAAESAAHRLRLRNLETPSRCRARALRRLRPPSEGGDSTFHKQPRNNQSRTQHAASVRGQGCMPQLIAQSSTRR
jgi:hypothetical protein